MKKDRREIPSSILFTALFTVVGVALLVAARLSPGFAESYRGGFYSFLRATIGSIVGLAPFSISEYLVPGVLALVLLDLIVHLIWRKHFKNFLKRFFVCLSLFFMLFAMNCGVNYYSKPFVDPETLATFEPSDALLTDFCEHIVSELNALDGAEYPEGKMLRSVAVQSMIRLGRDHETLGGSYPEPKELSFSARFFSMSGVTGIYSPFLIEANINGEMPQMNKPFTACHELSHLKGYMNEGEANYIGWLACVGSKNSGFQRSAWLAAWQYAGTALWRSDQTKYEELRAKLPESARRELEEDSAFWKEHKNKASDIQDKVNDAYLKANGQADGIKTYGQLTDLMLLWYEANKSTSTALLLENSRPN